MRLLFYSALEEHELAERFFHEFIERVYEFIGGYIERASAGRSVSGCKSADRGPFAFWEC